MEHKRFLHIATIGLLLLALLLPFGIVNAPQAAEASVVAFGVADSKEISAKALTNHECNDAEWHFVIT